MGDGDREGKSDYHDRNEDECDASKRSDCLRAGDRPSHTRTATPVLGISEAARQSEPTEDHARAREQTCGPDENDGAGAAGITENGSNE